jgi:hypothetical protein
MRFASKGRIMMAALALCGAAMGQQKVNPNTGINWPLATGHGAPTSACTSTNYLQPYQDTSITPNTYYTCGADGWQIRTGGPGPTGPQGPPGAATTLQTNGANNGSQSLLNLKSGTNITLTNTGGDVSIASTASGAGTARDIMATLATPPGYDVFGDSIGFGIGASDLNHGFAQLLRTPIGGVEINYSNSGDQCLDASVSIVGNAGFPAGSYPTSINECGTNDVTTYNTNANLQTVFKRVLTGNLLMASIPKANQIWAQTCTSTTGFATLDNNFRNGFGKSTAASGDVLTCPVNTDASGDVAVLYRISNGGTGTFTIKVNGTLQTDAIGSLGTTFDAFGDGSSTITTANNTTTGFAGQVFTGFTPNTVVSVVFTTTAASTTAAPVEIGFAGSIPASSTLNPNAVVISPNHQNNANDSLSGTYAGFEQAIVTQLSGYGLNITYSNTRDGMVAAASCGNGSVSVMFTNCYADSLHPNNTGHAAMAVITGASIPSLLTYAPTNLQNGAANIYAPVVTPLNPSTFWTPNPTNTDGVSTAWNPGILLFRQHSNVEFLTSSSIYGAILVGPSAGGNNAASLCSASTAWGSTPASLLCPISVTGNGIGRVGAAPGALGGIQGFNGNSGLGGFDAGATSTSSIYKTAFVSSTNEVIPTGVATSSANFASAPFCLLAGIWGGSSPGRTGACFRVAPATGTLPAVYMQLLADPNYTAPSAMGMDFSTATAGLRMPVSTVAALPTGIIAGTQYVVSDGAGAANAACTGSGSAYMVAIYNGSAWTCH